MNNTIEQQILMFKKRERKTRFQDPKKVIVSYEFCLLFQEHAIPVHALTSLNCVQRCFSVVDFLRVYASRNVCILVKSQILKEKIYSFLV